MTTVAITGATGFVGSAMARALAAEGKKIIALSRATSNRSILNGVDVSWVEGDALEPDSLKGAFNDADWLVHAAGLLGKSGISEAEYRQIHVDGTRNVLAEARHCSRILYISTPGVLGPTDGPAADETAPLNPSNAYERSKAEAEQIVLSFAEQGWPIIVVRPEFIYGPGDLHVLGLFKAVQRGLFFYVGQGRNTCHPTFIEDAVEGMLRCLEHGDPGEIYHITGPRPVTFRELGDTIAASLNQRQPWLTVPKSIAWLGAAVLEAGGKVLGKTPPLSRTGVAFFSDNRRFSWQKAGQSLGYEPKYDLATGIRHTVTWYRQQGLL